MDMLPFVEKNNVPSSNMNIFIEDVYHKHRSLLMKYETLQQDKKEIEEEEDPLSSKVQTIVSSLEEETNILSNEKDAMKKTFEKIALQLKNVKWSIMEAEGLLENWEEKDKKGEDMLLFQKMQNDIEGL